MDVLILAEAKTKRAQIQAGATRLETFIEF